MSISSVSTNMNTTTPHTAEKPLSSEDIVQIKQAVEKWGEECEKLCFQKMMNGNGYYDNCKFKVQKTAQGILRRIDCLSQENCSAMLQKNGRPLTMLDLSINNFDQATSVHTDKQNEAAKDQGSIDEAITLPPPPVAFPQKKEREWTIFEKIRDRASLRSLDSLLDGTKKKFHFSSEGAVDQCTKNHPLNQNPYLQKNGFLQNLPEIFANTTKTDTGVWSAIFVEAMDTHRKLNHNPILENMIDNRLTQSLLGCSKEAEEERFRFSNEKKLGQCLENAALNKEKGLKGFIDDLAELFKINRNSNLKDTYLNTYLKDNGFIEKMAKTFSNSEKSGAEIQRGVIQQTEQMNEKLEIYQITIDAINQFLTQSLQDCGKKKVDRVAPFLPYPVEQIL